MSNLRAMSAMNPEKADAPDLSALRIRRDPEKPGGGKRWLLVAAVVVVGLGVAAFFVTERGQSLVPKTVETVSASLVTEGQATTVLSAAGYIEADRKADLSPKITSKITELNVTEGSRVRKGDVIARLDHTDLDAQMADKKAGWENTQAELARQRSLFAQGLTTKEALDTAVANEASARANVRYVDALRDYTEIRAPFTGVVTAKRAFVGEAVSPYGSSPSGGGSGGAIVTLVDFSTLYVGADVNEANLARLAPKQPAEIVLDAYPDHAYHGHLLQIIPTADRAKGTVKVKVAFEDPDERILPEMSAKVNFTERPTTGAVHKSHVLVPESAVVQADGAPGVFLIAEGRAILRRVRTAPAPQGQVEILEGLQGGETLVADAGRAGVKSGERVKVKGM